VVFHRLTIIPHVGLSDEAISLARSLGRNYFGRKRQSVALKPGSRHAPRQEMPLFPRSRWTLSGTAIAHLTPRNHSCVLPHNVLHLEGFSSRAS
jgi:hypothetical protein